MSQVFVQLSARDIQRAIRQNPERSPVSYAVGRALGKWPVRVVYDAEEWYERGIFVEGKRQGLPKVAEETARAFDRGEFFRKVESAQVTHRVPICIAGFYVESGGD